MMNINRLQRTLEELKKIDPEFSLQRMELFLLVAQFEGCNKKQLAEWQDVALSTVQRNLSTLGDATRSGKPGNGLVETKIDPDETRRVACFLTKKGKMVIKSINEIMEIMV